jgi:hypothetical protein
LAIGSGDVVDIDGSKVNLNSGSAPEPTLVTIEQKSLGDVTYDGKVWTYSSGQIDSVCSVAPAHEPWTDSPGTAKRPKPV